MSQTYLKSSLNVHVVQVLFATKSCSPGFMSAWKLFPPTIWCVCGLPISPGLTSGSRRSTVSCEQAKRIIAAPRVWFCACAAPKRANACSVETFMMLVLSCQYNAKRLPGKVYNVSVHAIVELCSCASKSGCGARELPLPQAYFISAYRC
jgi:hypothetical protein